MRPLERMAGQEIVVLPVQYLAATDSLRWQQQIPNRADVSRGARRSDRSRPQCDAAWGGRGRSAARSRRASQTQQHSDDRRPLAFGRVVARAGAAGPDGSAIRWRRRSAGWSVSRASATHCLPVELRLENRGLVWALRFADRAHRFANGQNPVGRRSVERPDADGSRQRLRPASRRISRIWSSRPN